MRIPFLEFHDLMAPIPRAWKKELAFKEMEEEVTGDDLTLIDKFDDINNPSKMVYTIMLQVIFKPHTNKATKWLQYWTVE